MKRHPVFLIAILLLVIAPVFFMRQSSGFLQRSSQSEEYSNAELGVSFTKPINWNVFVDAGTVSAKPSPDSETKVFFYPILRAHPKMKALDFMRSIYDQSKTQFPDLVIDDKRFNENDTLAELSASYTRDGKEIKGFYMISLNEGRGIFCGYESAKNEFEAECSILKDVLKSLKITPVNFYNATKDGRFYSSANQTSEVLTPTIDINTLTAQVTPDGSMYLAVPPGWTVGGGNYSLIATSQDQKMGITATSDGQPGVTNPYDYLMNKLFPFYNCSNTLIHKREVNEGIMKFSRSQGYSSSAENFKGETTQPSGQKVVFWMMVNVAHLPVPGTGFVSTTGFYAIPELFERNANLLYAITASMAPNQSLIMSRLRENLNRFDQASQTISQTGDIVIQGLRSHTANWDRVIDKYNYYLSGEEAVYSPNDNRIYVVDSNNSKEKLTVVPDNLWSKLTHERN